MTLRLFGFVLSAVPLTCFSLQFKPFAEIHSKSLQSGPADCCQNCGKGFCSPKSGQCYDWMKKDYYLTCSSVSGPMIPGYQQHAHLNCYDGRGGTSLGPDRGFQRDVKSADACSKACDDDSSCSCFVFMWGQDKCYLHSQCVLESCEAGVQGQGSYQFDTFTSTENEEPPPVRESVTTTSVPAKSDSPCLCVFDIDRTLTGAQGHSQHCPGTQEIEGVHDEAYGSGWLTLSALSAHGISNTFCNQCYIGVSSTGNAGGENSKERAYLLEHVLVTDLQEKFNAQHPDATKWTYWGNVDSPLALHVPNTLKQHSVEDIRKWYQKKGVSISHEQVYFFGDRMENIPHFEELGFNAREISCETRDMKLYEGSGMVGFCGARPEEIVRQQGIHSCPKVDPADCCQTCGKGFCSPKSGQCYDWMKKDYYLTCGVNRE